MLIKKALMVLAFSLSLLNVFSQNNIKSFEMNSSENIKLLFNLEYKHLYQKSPFDVLPLIDPEVKKLRILDTSIYLPYVHGALYFSLGTNISYKDKYSLDFKLFAEQRSWSAGVNNTFTYKVFPQFKLDVLDTIKIKNIGLPIRYLMGDMYFDNENIAGLRAYNIDLQGFYSSIQFKTFNLNALYVADLTAGVGLIIDEYARFRFSKVFYAKLKLLKSIEVGLTSDYALLSRFYTGPKKDKFSYGAYTELNFNSNLKYLLIADYYPVKDNYRANGGTNNLALLSKISYNISTKKSILSVSPKFRYYGKYYRMGNYDSTYYGLKYRYRYNNPINDGGFLYPLKNYFRPVSQYALYSEYRGDYNVYSFELETKWDWNIYNKLGHQLDVELLNIHRDTKTSGNSYTYIYYTSFLYLRFFDNFKVGLYTTNKHMNRDVQYQTFYQMKYPFFGFHFTYDGSFRLK